jgi:large subunit ribosomal protein L22
MEARASAKFLRGSPQKARLVIDMIRGKNVNQALAILRYSNKRAALGIEKCVKSAIANANEAAEKANISVDPDDLWLKAAYVDHLPPCNNGCPAGLRRRRLARLRHFCHVTALVSRISRMRRQADGKGEAKPAVASRRRGGGNHRLGARSKAGSGICS